MFVCVTYTVDPGSADNIDPILNSHLPSSMAEESLENRDAGSEEDQLDGEPSSDAHNKRKKIHFSIDFDNHLLRATIAENPFELIAKDRTTAWCNVAIALDEQFVTSGMLPRTCRDRVERLLGYYEQDHPLLKSAADNYGENKDRMELLEQVHRLREKSSALLDKGVITPRKVRLGRRVMPRTSSENPTNGGTGASYVHPVYNTFNSVSNSNDSTMNPGNGNGLPRPNDTLVNMNGIESAAASGRLIRITANADGSYGIPYPVQPAPTGLETEERSLIKELLEARRVEDNRRREELEVRREELQVQRMKLELERIQWEAERKEREARLALEEQERKIVLEFMRKTLLTPSNGI